MARIALLLSLLVLGGCSPMVVTKEVPVTTTVYLTPNIPPVLLEPCQITPPPERKVYLSATPRQKEQMLTDYGIALHTDMKNCNSQLKEVTGLLAKHRELSK